MPPKSVCVDAGQGRALWIAGDLVTIKLTGDETGEAFTAIETTVPPGGGPPLHVHRREDETFFVLEGAITFTVGDMEITAPKGTCAFGPRDTPHRYFNATDKPARMLVVISPAGFEKYFEKVGTPVNDLTEPPPPVTPEVIEKLLGAAEAHGLEFVQ